MKCPVCQTVHSDRDWSPTNCSHGALVVYTSAQCPICLDESRPVVALPCGHLLCKLDFGKLGGYIRSADDVNTRPYQPLDRYRVPEVSIDEDDDFDSQEDGPRGVWDVASVMYGVSDLDIPRLRHVGEVEGDASGAGEAARLLPDVTDDDDSDSDSDDSDSDDSSDGWDLDSDSDESSDWCDDDEESAAADFLWGAPEIVTVQDRLSSARDDAHRHPPPTIPPQPTSARAFRSLKAGVWLLNAEEGDNTSCELMYVAGARCRGFGLYPRSSKLIVDGRHRSVLVYAPLSDENSVCRNTWGVHYVRFGRAELIYKLRPRSQVVADRSGGVWSCYQQGHEQQVVFFNSRLRDGKPIMSIPLKSRLISDVTGGVWIHIQQESTNNSSSPDSLRAGLWHVTSQKQDFIAPLSSDAKCVSDCNGGVWVLSRTEPFTGYHRLCRLRRDALWTEGNVLIRSKAAKMVSDGKDGVYIHDLGVVGRWVLYHMKFEDDNLREVCDCPRNSRLVSDANGGVWIMKPRTRTCSMRCLIHMTQRGHLDTTIRFAVGSVLSGI